MNNSEVPDVPEFMREALRHAMMKEFDRLKKEMVDELERNRDQIVAGLMIHVMKRVSMHDMVTHLQITIDKTPNPPH